VAPEKELSKWLRSISTEYLSIDISAEAMAKMDITDLELEDNSQTLIWASHVLEHVVDDRKAIAELYRVLAPGGVAFIQVPIWRTQTFEDFNKSTPEERLMYGCMASILRIGSRMSGFRRKSSGHRILAQTPFLKTDYHLSLRMKCLFSKRIK
jgi:predicted SAM-dependent methyltransferase